MAATPALPSPPPAAATAPPQGRAKTPAGPPTTAVLTITDNDVAANPGQLQFSAATYSVAENGGNASITITRTGGSDGTVTVQVNTTGGTAASGTDYTPPANNTLSFGPGVTS